MIKNFVLHVGSIYIRVIVEMDFCKVYFFLEPRVITHWESPYENIDIGMDEKKA